MLTCQFQCGRMPRLAFAICMIMIMMMMQSSHSFVTKSLSRNGRLSGAFPRGVSFRRELEEKSRSTLSSSKMQDLFDSSSSSSSSDSVTATTPSLNSLQTIQDQEKQGEMSLWAARGILLLVAAIWGTNFAVRCELVLHRRIYLEVV